jgi:hypothetical protein
VFLVGQGCLQRCNVSGCNYIVPGSSYSHMNRPKEWRCPGCHAIGVSVGVN